MIVHLTQREDGEPVWLNINYICSMRLAWHEGKLVGSDLVIGSSGDECYKVRELPHEILKAAVTPVESLQYRIECMKAEDDAEEHDKNCLEAIACDFESGKLDEHPLALKISDTDPQVDLSE